MSKTIIFSDGGKGGVGKSLVTICIVDYLLANSKNVLLVDVDVNNPEVARLFENQKSLPSLTYDLQSDSEWMAFGDAVETHYKSLDYVVVNLPAAIDITAYLDLYGDTFKSLGFDITVFFTINRQRDSINLLGQSLQSGTMSLADNKVVVKNGIFGLEEDFHRFDASQAREDLIDQGGKEIYIRELFHESLDLCLIEHKKTFSLAIKDTMKLFPRYQIQKWINDVHNALSTVLLESSAKASPSIHRDKDAKESSVPSTA